MSRLLPLPRFSFYVFSCFIGSSYSSSGRSMRNSISLPHPYDLRFFSSCLSLSSLETGAWLDADPHMSENAHGRKHRPRSPSDQLSFPSFRRWEMLFIKINEMGCTLPICDMYREAHHEKRFVERNPCTIVFSIQRSNTSSIDISALRTGPKHCGSVTYFGARENNRREPLRINWKRSTRRARSSSPDAGLPGFGRVGALPLKCVLALIRLTVWGHSS
jgi:hypothetical protein